MLPGSARPGLEGAVGPEPAARRLGRQPVVGVEQRHTTKKAPGRGTAGPAVRPENEPGGGSVSRFDPGCFYWGCWEFGFSTAANHLPEMPPAVARFVSYSGQEVYQTKPKP